MRRIRGRRSSADREDGFGVSLMDLLTTALGCVLLIFIVYSVVTSGDLQRYLSQNSDLVQALKDKDSIIAVQKGDAAALRAMIEELKGTLTAQEQAALEERAQREEAQQVERTTNARSLQALFSELKLLKSALDPNTARPVDVMLVIDGTNSMAPSLQAVRQNLRVIIGALKVLSPTARVGVTVYRDFREPPDLRLEHQPLSKDASVLKKFLDGIKAESTNADDDRPEWMCGGLRAAILGVDQADTDESRAARAKSGERRGKKRRRGRRRAQRRKAKAKGSKARRSRSHEAGWRERAIKIVIVVSDAGTNSAQAQECIKVAKQFHAQGGQVHVVSTLPKHYRQRPKITKEYDDEVLRDHENIATAGGGEHIKRAAESTLLEEVLKSAFRSRLAELEKLKGILKSGEEVRESILKGSGESKTQPK